MSENEDSTAKRRTGPRRVRKELSSVDGRIFKAAERRIFAANVRAARRALGWSKTELARRIDADGGYVFRVEEARLNISIDRMATFASALNQPLHQLLHPGFMSDSKNTNLSDLQLQAGEQPKESVKKWHRKQKDDESI